VRGGHAAAVRLAAASAVLVLVLVLAACGGGGGDGRGSITVAAAASLTEAFIEIGEGFAVVEPGAEVAFTFDSSSRLAAQIVEGAPADVFASADEVAMATLTDQDLVAGEPVVFAANAMVIVTEPGNPRGITGPADLTDLADAGVIALCAAEAPCGRLAAEVLDRAGAAIPEARVTRAQNVKATLTAVAQGDAVAGIVYATDAATAGDGVATVPIPPTDGSGDADGAITSYPIAALAAAADPDAAAAFVAYVRSPPAQAVLRAHGFRPPP
jgi:molybdate transport system substrate-binding protein